MVTVGGINLANAIVDLERRVSMLEQILDKVMQHVPPGAVTRDDLAAMQDRTIAALKRKYPEAGIVWTPGRPAA